MRGALIRTTLLLAAIVISLHIFFRRGELEPTRVAVLYIADLGVVGFYCMLAMDERIYVRLALSTLAFSGLAFLFLRHLFGAA